MIVILNAETCLSGEKHWCLSRLILKYVFLGHSLTINLQLFELKLIKIIIQIWSQNKEDVSIY